LDNELTLLFFLEIVIIFQPCLRDHTISTPRATPKWGTEKINQSVGGPFLSNSFFGFVIGPAVDIVILAFSL
jgi:hypothetical protein